MSLNAPRLELPRLNALRAFEAAARHESFIAAADELSVTAGAVAQQIKSLEAWFGQSLFYRHSQGVRLTQSARTALPELIKAFDALGGAVRYLKDLTDTDKIRIAALPAVAQLWLSPRLPRIYESLPGVEISVSALEEPPNLNRELFDLSLFFRDSESTGDGITICRDELTPVCSPKFFEKAISLEAPNDLLHVPLLHDAVWKNDWEHWLEVAGASGIDVTKGSTYSLYSMAVQAAIDGAGILMGHTALIKESLDDGRLVRPFEKLVFPGQYLILRLPVSGHKTKLLGELVGILT